MTGIVIRTVVRLILVGSLGLGGCNSISIAPSCPIELAVGDSGLVWANEINPGAIPTYEWKAFPADAGTFEDATLPSTLFTAAKAGNVTLRLTAADGLYQVVSQCTTVIVEALSVEVAFQIDPATIPVGESAVLFCSSFGEAEAVTRSLSQTAGPTLTLDSLTEGVATVTPDEVGTYTFECIGRTESGRESDPVEATLTVEPADGDGGDRGDDRPPVRPPRG